MLSLRIYIKIITFELFKSSKVVEGLSNCRKLSVSLLVLSSSLNNGSNLITKGKLSEMLCELLILKSVQVRNR